MVEAIQETPGRKVKERMTRTIPTEGNRKPNTLPSTSTRLAARSMRRLDLMAAILKIHPAT